MESIVAVTLSLLKKTESFIAFESTFIPILAQLVCAQVAEALEELDDRLCLGKHWQILRRDPRSIQCLFGTIQFRRRLVRNQEGVESYPLDERLGLTRGRRYSPLMMARVAELASHTVLRTVSLAVDAFTPGSISFQTVDKIYQQVGTDLEEVQVANMAATPKPKSELKQVPRLYLEGDAFQVRLKHGQRVMVHRLQVSEGVNVNGKRHELINRHVISGLDREHVFDQMVAYLDAHYDRKHTQIITGSDNGSGYESSVFQVFAPTRGQHTHLLDVYHLNRKIKERFNGMPKALAKLLREAVFSGNHVQLDIVMDTAESIASGDLDFSDEAVENISLLRGYLERNWDSITPLATCDWHHTGLGSCESNHRAYTYRLKKQGKSWSKAGLTAMLLIIDAGHNHDLEQALSQTKAFDTPLPRVEEASVQVPKGFSMKALFGAFSSAEHAPGNHSGAFRGSVNAQGVVGTSFGRMARTLNDLNYVG